MHRTDESPSARRAEGGTGSNLGSLISASLMLVACAAKTSGTRPDDMSAQEHRRAAEAHEQAAAQQEAAYEPEASSTRPRTFGFPVVRRIDADSSELADQEYGYSTRDDNPTAIHQKSADREREHAAQHRRAARVLESFMDGECQHFPPEARVLCPVTHAVTEVESVEGGVLLHLPPKVQAEAVLAHMRCHHAFGRYHGFEGMSQCPLYLPGIEISLDENHGAIRVVSTDREVAQLIQKRSTRTANTLTTAPSAKGSTP